MIEQVHLLATIYMMGLIWFVQRVHYPLFAHVGTDQFTEYEKLHNRFTSRAVMPAMLIELGSAAWLLIQQPGPLYFTGMALIAIIWGSTFLLQVPCHTRLLSGFDTDTHRRLVQTNWIRTIGWTLRSLLFAYATISP